MTPWRGAILLVGLFALFPVRAPAAQWELARLAFSSGWDGLPASVAIERGFFAQEGLVVSGLAATSAQHVINSLAAGTTDFAAVPQRTLLAMAALKVPVKVVSVNGWGTEMELVVPKDDAAVKTMADLKGKAIAVGVGSEAYPALIRLVAETEVVGGPLALVGGAHPQDLLVPAIQDGNPYIELEPVEEAIAGRERPGEDIPLEAVHLNDSDDDRVEDRESADRDPV